MDLISGFVFVRVLGKLGPCPRIIGKQVYRMRKITWIVLFFMTAGFFSFAADAKSPSGNDAPPFCITVAPALEIPFGNESLGLVGADVPNNIYGILGVSGRLSAKMMFGANSMFGVTGGIGYHLAPVEMPNPISHVSAELGGSFGLEFAPRFTLWAEATGGGYWSFFSGLDNSFHQGFGVSFSGGLGVDFLISPLLSIKVGAGYKNLIGIYQGFNALLGTSIYLSGQGSRQATLDSSRPALDLLSTPRAPEKGQGIEITDIVFDPVFPVFYKYYDDHPIGRIILKNPKEQPATDVKLSMLIKQYMDAPKSSGIPAKIEAGQSLTVDLLALLTNKVFELTENTKVMAEITLEYRMGDSRYRDVQTRSIRVYDRNSMSWEDDRRAAAFVTFKDPIVMALARKSSGIASGTTASALNANFLTGIAIHEALGLYGLRYSFDPSSSFVEKSADKTQVDYLQFPIQTLQGRFGDCDDLSILYCSLFESVSIPTAFITTPGHIYMAFSTDLSAEDAKSFFGRLDDLILMDGKAWIPIEVTLREGGFVKAWQAGAKEWREASQGKKAAFLRISDAWKLYEPVGLPSQGGDVQTPAEASIKKAFDSELSRFINQELGPRIAAVQDQIKASGNLPVLVNKMGVLYARFGQLDKAAEQFTKAMGNGSYLPAVTNLGGVYFQKKDMEKALGFYQKAAALSPENPNVLINLARVNYELENFGTVKQLYSKAASLDPQLAGKFAYLDAKADETVRASSQSASKGAMVWMEE